MPNYVTNIELNKNELRKAVIHLLSTAPSSPTEGQIYYDTTLHHLFIRTNSAWQDLTDALTLNAQAGSYYLDRTNHTGSQAQSTITSLVSDLALKAPLASPTFTGTVTVPTPSGGDNSTKAASTAFVTSAISTAVTGLLNLKGATDCSANPNYPAGVVGDLYYVTVAGKIGGSGGKSVDIGDAYICKANNAGGTEASVGTSWFVLEHNLVGALLSANNLSDLTSTSAARTNLGVAIGVDVQAYNTDLAAIAGLSPSNDDIIQRKAGAWTNRTLAQLKSDLSLSGSNTGDQTISDATITTSDITTNNATTSKHGFLKKLSGNSTDMMAGDGNWTAVPSSALRYSADVGDGSSTSIVVTHSLGTRDLTVALYDKTTPFQKLEPDVYMTSTSTVTLGFSVAPTSNQYRVVITG